MKNLFYRLIVYIDTADENDLYYQVALYMAVNFYRIADMRISEMAKACYVSAATISRFCRELGYENFAHLKQESTGLQSHASKFNNLIDVDPNKMSKQPSMATAQYVEQVTASLKQLPATLDWYIIDQVLHLIHETENVVLFGTQFSNSAAVNFQTDLLMLEKFTVAYMDSERQKDCAMKMGKDDLAVVISLNGNYLQGIGQKIIKYLKRSRCRMVLITSLDEAMIDDCFSYTIHLGTPTNGKAAKHALLMAMELMSLRYYCLYYPSLDELKGYMF